MLNLSPIGYLRSTDKAKFSVPHQSPVSENKNHYIELNPGNNFEAALKDLQDFERIWIVWWFNKNSNWRPCVLPPRGKAQKRGVFATRSPHRPNPIGISCVKLIKIKGRKIYISDSDLIDGTPVFDIKPYIPEVDSFPDSKAGWVDELKEDRAFSVKLSEFAKKQLDWLEENWQINFLPRAVELLSKDPSPHRTRRISALRDGSFRMGCGPWRIFFTLNGAEVEITSVAPGYPLKALKDPAMNQIVDREAQISFSQIWP